MAATLRILVPLLAAPHLASAAFPTDLWNKGEERSCRSLLRLLIEGRGFHGTTLHKRWGSVTEAPESTYFTETMWPYWFNWEDGEGARIEVQQDGTLRLTRPGEAYRNGRCYSIAVPPKPDRTGWRYFMQFQVTNAQGHKGDALITFP